LPCIEIREINVFYLFYFIVANNWNNIRLLTPKSVNSTTQRCPKTILKTFLIEDFYPFSLSHCTLNCEYLRIFSQKIENGPIGILRGLGETGA
jgi:hypothetical protein